MSIILKVRVWDVQDKCYFIPSKLILNNDAVACIYGPTGREVSISSKNYIVEYFTQYRDKKGNEIYEGDIVEHYSGIRYKVIYCDLNKCYHIITNDYVYNVSGKQEYLGYCLGNYEVVGNIRENIF